MDLLTYGRAQVRPRLPLPLAPPDGLGETVLRSVGGFRGPTFRRPRAFAPAWALLTAAAAAVVVAAPLGAWRIAMLAVLAPGCLYLLLRSLTATLVEGRQARFEDRWLAAQTDVLRDRPFEVLRFSVEESPGARRFYDLTRPDDVRALLETQRTARQGGSSLFRGAPAGEAGSASVTPSSASEKLPATVEIAYRTDEGTTAVAAVYRDLADLRIHPGTARPAMAWARFPQARYHPAPGPAGRPAETAQWVLSGDVVVGTAGPA
ncbi:hypothetical protein [Actinomadura oligospora]|uniref:hypothetical protein n=1 Tax=Actinomadura oligospora TaxID=111804 RepID=UPI00047E8DFE|nr:hypothetical protein [Actinomadura oligospora]